MGRGWGEEEEEFVVVWEDWGWVRDDERTTERARRSRGELFATGEREEGRKWSLSTREERGGAFSCIFVRDVPSSFLSCDLSEEEVELWANTAAGRLVALNAEDLTVALAEERGREE